ncbi:hypothetical protein [Methylocapsa sp. S129]|uniref:hypothetical protein n=1 Tax=Methylocapsa sp. S129 TaxID=1641869 RepID=UPI00131B4009|nr:hypothetical protein [Methylocapsa sp. S129]
MTYESALEAPGRVNVSGFLASRTFWLLAAVVLLAAAVQIHWGVNTDTSWNITLAEKALDGARPYVDFIEINPPLSFLIYLPPILVARLSGTAPEFVIDLFCFVGAALSLWLSGIVLARGGAVTPAAGSRLAAIAFAVLLLLPMRAFSEREHIALMASLPCLAALAVWASRERVEPILSLLAGLGAGLAIAIKPHFALFFLPNLTYLAWRTGWRSLVPRIELWAALAAVALYWTAVALWCPAFFERAVPIARDIYVPFHKPLSTLPHDPTIHAWIALGALLAFAARKRWAEPLVAVPALASAGAMAAYLIQSKLWAYQAYPALALLVLALLRLILENPATPHGARIAPGRLAVAVLSALMIFFAGVRLSLGGHDSDRLERAVAQIAPHPKILTIAPGIGDGHPLTRRVQGVWVGSVMSLWITEMSDAALRRNPTPEDARKFEAYRRLDRQTLVADIVDKKPDAILIVGDDWLAWAHNNADVAAALAEYHLREAVDDVMIYARNDAER